MSAMEWKTLPVDALRPAAYNPRKKLKAGDKEYEKIKNSILEFGYVEPIIANYDMHERLRVAPSQMNLFDLTGGDTAWLKS